MDKRKKILLVITKSELGGAQVFVLNLARELRKKGMAVSAAIGDNGFLSEELEKNNIACFELKSLKRSVNPLKIFSYLFEIYNLIKKERFDTVHFNSTNTLAGALSAKIFSGQIKTVFTFHGLSLLDEGYKDSFLLKMLNYIYFKIFLLFVDEQVFVSRFNFERALKIKLTKKAEVIYNGILDPEDIFLKKDEARSNLEKKYHIKLSDYFVIGTIGRLDYQKNHEFLIKLMPAILEKKENVKILIIGDGEERSILEKKIRNNNLEGKIILLGSIKDAQVYLKSFDLFVLPSRYEGLSISLIEALFSGVPILASNVGGNREVLSDSRDQLFELDNKDDFLDKIVNLQEEDLGNSLAICNKKNSMKFLSGEMREKYFQLYS